MKRSWVFLFYDLALFAILLLPLAAAVAATIGRTHAAAIYAIALGPVLAAALLIARATKVTPRVYLRSLNR